ncbi:MAG: hypothetical protein KDA75_16815, partial [Planctomycetaceae bacterium]|nr:hypothetical protein [Planctomycetaceae bacterium]
MNSVGSAHSAAEQLAAMAAELQQRDQLIETLTERLEEAAEQLDRIHRTGGNRGGGGSTAMPAEALEYLYSVAERTDQMVGEWTELEAGHLLCRLDARIENLIEVLRGDGSHDAGGYTPPTSFIPDDGSGSTTSNDEAPAKPAEVEDST